MVQVSGTPEIAANAAVTASFAHQALWCDRLGSPFTAALLRALLVDLAGAGPLTDLIGAWPGDPMADIVPLRVAGALHALVLAGRAPDLAAIYPPRALPDQATLAASLRDAVRTHAAFIERFIQAAPQTNEVARSSVLLGGFLEIAAATGLPLRLLEIGASAGLNLLWDRFSYRLGEARWGNAASPVHLAPVWEGNLPPLGAPVRVAARAGCDLSPIDLNDPAQRLRLRAYVWADQADRMARLDGAIALAAANAVALEQCNATDFLSRHLATAAVGQATVLYHSIMWNYVAAADKADIEAILHAAAARATNQAPFAWLRFELESADSFPALTLTLWPGGEARQLAVGNPHGASVTWLV